jgi:hypothetical protein
VKYCCLATFHWNIFTFSAKKLFENMICCTYFNIKNSWALMFWTFNLGFDILATVSATFPNIRRIFALFSGHPALV